MPLACVSCENQLLCDAIRIFDVASYTTTEALGNVPDAK